MSMKLLTIVYLLLGCQLMAGEVWITQSPSGSTPGGTGTHADPYTVPVGDNTTFDTLVGAQPTNTTIHLQAGTFLTKGRAETGLIMKAGCKLLGQGMGITTIKVDDNSFIAASGIALCFERPDPALLHKTEIRGLTIDCNFGNQGSSVIKGNGISGGGFHALIEKVEIINIGSRGSGDNEAFGILVGNYNLADVSKPSSVTIRDCIVHKPWSGTAGGISAICPAGHNAWGGVIEGCYVDLTEAVNSNGTYGITFAGSADGLVIAHNTAIKCHRGIHVDTAGEYTPKVARNVVIKANRIVNCASGISMGGPDKVGETPETSLFEYFIIESNAIEMRDSTFGIALWGHTKGFQVKNNSIITHPLATVGAAGPYRIAIRVSEHSSAHEISGNRFGPAPVAKFIPVEPAALTSPIWKKNKIENNTYSAEESVPKSIVSLRYALNESVLPLPAGSARWNLALGSSQADSNPTTALVSSDIDGTNVYTYYRMSKLPFAGYASGHTIVFDPAGTAGVWVGDNDSGRLTAGGIISSNTGVGLAQGAKLVMVEGGTAARMGQATLVGGTVTVNTTGVKANSRIFLTSQQDGGTPGTVRISSRTAGTSFVIQSSSATDTSQIAWFIIDPSY